MKKKSRFLMKVLALTVITLTALTLVSCRNQFPIYIGYKNPNINYGLYTAFYNGKMYFKNSSAIFAVDSKENTVSKACNANIDGQLFSVDQNVAYIIDFFNYPYHNAGKFKITSVKLDGSDKKVLAEYKFHSPAVDEPYYVHNGLVYKFGSNTCFKGNSTVLGDFYNIQAVASSYSAWTKVRVNANNFIRQRSLMKILLH